MTKNKNKNSRKVGLIIVLCFLTVVIMSSCHNSEPQNSVLPTPTLDDPHDHVVDVNHISIPTEIKIVEVAIDPDIVQENVAVNQSGTLKAFTTYEESFNIFVEDTVKGVTMEIQGFPSSWRPFSDLVWITDGILVFDRWSNPHYGIHYAINIREKALLSAAPFPDQISVQEGSPAPMQTTLSIALTFNSPCPNVSAIPHHLNSDSLSSNESRIAFSMYTTWQTQRDIYVVQEDGSGLKRLTNVTHDEDHPVWSPYGNTIVFEGSYEDKDQGNLGHDLYWLNLADETITKLTNDGKEKHSPAWSPDGSYIAFSLFTEEGWQNIGVINVETGDCRLIVFHSSDNLTPTWSPDGQHIAFSSNRTGAYDIYRLSLEDNVLVNLTQNDADDFAPSWSPDGQFIAFVSSRNGNSEIYTMAADGSEVIQITKNPENDLQPVWSPDGKRLVFRSERDGNVGLFIMDRSGDNPVFLDATFDALWPTWQP